MSLRLGLLTALALSLSLVLLEVLGAQSEYESTDRFGPVFKFESNLLENWGAQSG